MKCNPVKSVELILKNCESILFDAPGDLLHFDVLDVKTNIGLKGTYHKCSEFILLIQAKSCINTDANMLDRLSKCPNITMIKVTYENGKCKNIYTNWDMLDVEAAQHPYQKVTFSEAVNEPDDQVRIALIFQATAGSAAIQTQLKEIHTNLAGYINRQ